MSKQYVIKRFDDEGQFQGYVCIEEEFSLVPTLEEATKFELDDDTNNIVYYQDGERIVRDMISFTIYTLSIPLSHLMVTVESEEE